MNQNLFRYGKRIGAQFTLVQLIAIVAGLLNSGCTSWKGAGDTKLTQTRKSIVGDWSSFEKYQGTITEKEFRALIDNVYNPSQAIYAYLQLSLIHI